MVQRFHSRDGRQRGKTGENEDRGTLSRDRLILSRVTAVVTGGTPIVSLTKVRIEGSKRRRLL